jgi:hypothetical protein
MESITTSIINDLLIALLSLAITYCFVVAYSLGLQTKLHFAKLHDRKHRLTDTCASISFFKRYSGHPR